MCDCRLAAARALMLVAARAEYDDEGKDDDPSAVVVKEMAQTVVIHSVLQSCIDSIRRSFPYAIIVCKWRALCDISFFFFIFIGSPVFIFIGSPVRCSR